jgi:hypothetical protein
MFTPNLLPPQRTQHVFRKLQGNQPHGKMVNAGKAPALCGAI